MKGNAGIMTFFEGIIVNTTGYKYFSTVHILGVFCYAIFHFYVLSLSLFRKEQQIPYFSLLSENSLKLLFRFYSAVFRHIVTYEILETSKYDLITD